MSGPAIIVGASHGGVQLAVSLRQAGWQEPIHLFSAEDALPYHRPPLSKALLAGEKTEEQILLRAGDFYASQGIELHLGEPILSVDPHAATVTTIKGTYPYAKLVLATGSAARRLDVPGHDLAGIYTLRDIADARQLKQALAEVSSVAVIGGGFIGLEFASTAVKSGKPTTVIEMQDRLLARALPASVASFLGDYHRAKGVNFIHGVGIAGFEGTAGHIEALTLADGRRVDADLVLIGIGGQATLDLARQIGLAVEAGGILVDAHGQTSAPDIFAIGDVAAFHNAYVEAPMRLESVQNAVDQAKSSAIRMTGGNEPLIAVPWFWTDQYDLKVQMAGLGHPGATEIVRGEPASGAFTLLQVRDDVLVGAHTVNRAADHMAARRLIQGRTRIDTARAADVDTPLLKTTLDAAG